MAPVSPLRSGVARFSPALDNRSAPAAPVKSPKSSAVLQQQGTRPSGQLSDLRFTQDTFTPDAGSSANAVRMRGANPAAQASATTSPTANPGNRPAPSYPDPLRLPGVDASKYEYGQVGTSPNETGIIGGAAELAQYAYAGYNGGEFGPVSIAPAKLKEGDTTTDAYVVSLSGTEGVKGQSTGWITNFKSGSQLNSPGLRNAKEAILRTVPEGSDLILTGHSQGGMIAQQLAGDKDLKAKYNIKSTVAFGSPLISLGKREGEVHRIAATLDPVPKLSAESIFGLPYAIAGEQKIGTHTLNPIRSHTDNYTDESNRKLSRMDALGRVNPETPATLEIDIGQRVFFTSPTKTVAGTKEGGKIPPPPIAPLSPEDVPPGFPGGEYPLPPMGPLPFPTSPFFPGDETATA